MSLSGDGEGGSRRDDSEDLRALRTRGGGTVRLMLPLLTVLLRRVIDG